MKMSKKRRIVTTVIGSLCALVIGVAGGWYIRKRQEPKPAHFVRENPADYKFVDPILLIQVPEDDSTPEFQTLKGEISKYITTTENNKKAGDVSVYFRELNTDRWVGIHQTDVYAPASMLKVISLIAFLRKAQEDPSLYTKKIKITSDNVNIQVGQDFYPPANPVQVGHVYGSTDLLSHMIINSDNTAANAVDGMTGVDSLNKTFNNLLVPIPGPNTPDDFISPMMYSRLFRSLYNGTYLSPVISEQALELLSKTTFNNGLMAGVPSGTVVSHKFGERTVVTSTGSNQHELHDCGIVYAPTNPYLLCVMTKGDDFTNLQGVIGDISAIVWKDIAEKKN